MGYHSAIFGNSYQFYEYACFWLEENDTNVLYRLHVGEVVTIEDSHKKSDDQQFAFISVDRFEITNRVSSVQAPRYKQTATYLPYKRYPYKYYAFHSLSQSRK
jgi:hypothetical protein